MTKSSALQRDFQTAKIQIQLAFHSRQWNPIPYWVVAILVDHAKTDTVSVTTVHSGSSPYWSHNKTIFNDCY